MGKKLLPNLFLIAFLFLSLGMQTGQEVRQVGPLSPAPSQENGEMTDETPSLWFVELSGTPLADGGTMATLSQEKASFRAQARAVGLRFNERFAFDKLWNGFSISIDKEDLAKLSRIPGVKALYPVITISVPKQQPAENYIDLITALSMTGADIAQSELGFTGEGVRVGIIDTGIDYDHADLGGDGVQRSNSAAFPTGRVVTGWDFVGDAYDSSTNPVPVPDAYPDDCAGHGTHVSGIVGANGVVKGVAPNVKFGAYRVFGCAGTTSADIMIAAMERALADRMDIINMSIGSAYQWPQYPTAQASDRLVNKGVVVVASIGNNGTNGTFAAGAPGVGKKVIGVASFDNTAQNLAKFTVSPDNAAVGYITATGCPPAPVTGTFAMARTGTPTTTNDACNPLPAGSLTGKIALIRRGTCSFYVKAYNAQQAGAVGVVLYNNTTGIVSPTVAGSPPITIPVVSISAVDGVLINSRLAAGPVSLTWTDQAVSLPNSTGNLISSFSSYGLSPDLSVKPDLAAPGGYVRSTYPIELGSYANLSGTSMASPHVAGAVALLLQAKPHTSSQAVRSILQNSSIPHVWWSSPSSGYLDNVHRQGAGMLRIDDAILSTTKIEPGKLAAGEGQAGPSTHTLTLENNGMVTTTYDLSFVNALSTNRAIAYSSASPVAPITFWTSDAYVTFSSPNVTVPAGGTASVYVTIYPALGPPEGQYGGYIVFTPQGGGQVYRVPFAGFVDDYQSIVALSPTPYGFPWLAKVIGSSYVKQPLGATYTLTPGDVPYILLHLDHQVRRLRLEVFSTAGKAWHRAFDDEYLGRNTYATSFFAIPWDGKTLSGNKIWTVPNGTYVIKLSVLKALGNDTNPADWETWTSPVITISRP